MPGAGRGPAKRPGPVRGPAVLLALPAAIVAHRQAVEARFYRQAGVESLSAEEGAALDRLAALAASAEARARLGPLRFDDDEVWSAETKGRIFVADCITAFRVDRGFHTAQRAKLKVASAALEKAQKNLGGLRAYFGVVEPDGTDFDVVESGASAEPSRSLQEKLDRRGYAALHSLQGELDYDRRAIDEVGRTLSRRRDAMGARSGAHGCLKQSVKGLCGQPLSKRLLYRSVATFADALFATKTPTHPQAVKDAMTPSEWLDRRFRLPPRRDR